MKAKEYLKEFKERHGISDREIWERHELIKLMEGYEYSHREVKKLNIDDVSNSFCSHTMTRNPKEYQENKCRLCKKPYQK